MDAKLTKLFGAYEKAYSALDFETSAGFFADTFISAGPKGTIAQNKSEFKSWAKKAADFYRGVGLEYGKILATTETSIADHHSIVEVHWGVKFRKTGAKLIEFDITYIIDKTGPQPKIIMFISHEDEEEAMKKLGLL